MNIQHKKGFTLIELMIVVAIISIIAAVAYPSYTSSVQKSRRADSMGAMMSFAQAMERHYTANNSYLGAATGGANTGAPTIFPTETPIDSNAKFYDLTIQTATASTYTLRATPKNGQEDDGNLELDHTGAKRRAGETGWD